MNQQSQTKLQRAIELQIEPRNLRSVLSIFFKATQIGRSAHRWPAIVKISYIRSCELSRRLSSAFGP